jgi:hypothetical protein
MQPRVSIDYALRSPKLLGGALGPIASWEKWLVVLNAFFGGELNREQRRAFAAIAGDRSPPERKCRELWCVIGRRAGKSRMAAAIASYVTTCCDHSANLAPGEIGYVLVLALSRDQANAIFEYILAFIDRSPDLADMIEAPPPTKFA